MTPQLCLLCMWAVRPASQPVSPASSACSSPRGPRQPPPCSSSAVLRPSGSSNRLWLPHSCLRALFWTSSEDLSPPGSGPQSPGSGQKSRSGFQRMQSNQTRSSYPLVFWLLLMFSSDSRDIFKTKCFLSLRFSSLVKKARIFQATRLENTFQRCYSNLPCHLCRSRVVESKLLGLQPPLSHERWQQRSLSANTLRPAQF